MDLFVQEIGIDRQFHPPNSAGDKMYRYAIPQPIDRLIGVPIGVVQGARDVWRYLLQDRGRRSSSVLGA